MITVIGIGGAAGELTDRARKAIAGADFVAVRTGLSAAGKALVREFGGKVGRLETLDALYERAGNFDELNESVASFLDGISARYARAVYCVDGDGYCDATAAYYDRLGGVAEIVPGVSEHGARRPGGALTTVSAYELLDSKAYLDPALPLLVCALDNSMLAGAVKLYLMEFYGDDAPVRFCAEGKTTEIALTDLDRQPKYGYSASAYLAASADFKKERYAFGDLTRILNRLTAPDGCPWDRVQTHESIRINLIEEAYEAADAIDGGNPDDMAEEFGDVLLQALFHCDIAERHGEFCLSDVIGTLCRKLVGRHTHIFGADHAPDGDEALRFWEKAKAEEKSYTSVSDQLARLPESFPAALRAEKTLKKIAKAGGKADGESLKAALGAGISHLDAQNAGRLLLALVALTADAGLDAEVELSGAARGLAERFAAAESDGTAAGFLARELTGEQKA